MSVTAAAVVLAWACLVLLALALAGLLRQVRDLQADLTEFGAQCSRPLRGRRIDDLAGTPAAMLVIDPGCGSCVPVLATFAEVAEATPGVRFEVLCHRASPDWPGLPAVRLRVDERLYRQLDVPWAPALLTIDADGAITSAGPVDSPTDLRHQLFELRRAAARPLSKLRS